MEAVAAAASSAATFMAAALWCARAGARERRRRWGAQREGAGVEEEPLARVMEEQGTRRRAARGGEQGRSSHMAATHGARGMRWGISANSWRATEWTWWEADLGRLGCELDFGPKMKFASFLTLCISYLRSQVIRALDQRVIRLQVNSVNALTAMNKSPN